MHLIPLDTASWKHKLTWFPWHHTHYPPICQPRFSVSPSPSQFFSCLQSHECKCSLKSVLGSWDFLSPLFCSYVIIHLCFIITHMFISLKPKFQIPNVSHIFQILHWPFLCVGHLITSNLAFWKPNFHLPSTSSKLTSFQLSHLH